MISFNICEVLSSAYILKKPLIKNRPFHQDTGTPCLNITTYFKSQRSFTLLFWQKQTKKGFTIPVGQWFSTLLPMANCLFLFNFYFHLISSLSMLLPQYLSDPALATSWADLLPSLLAIPIRHCLNEQHLTRAGKEKTEKCSFSSPPFPAPAMPLTHSSFPFPAPAASGRVQTA